jgi:hypothetical protein
LFILFAFGWGFFFLACWCCQKTIT